MPKRIQPGHYQIGENHEDRHSRNRGEFGVIRGDVAMENGHLEWGHFCEGSLHSSKWYAYRVGPARDGTGRCVDTDLLTVENSKTDAVDYLKRKYDLDLN